MRGRRRRRVAGLIRNNCNVNHMLHTVSQIRRCQTRARPLKEPEVSIWRSLAAPISASVRYFLHKTMSVLQAWHAFRTKLRRTASRRSPNPSSYRFAYMATWEYVSASDISEHNCRPRPHSRLDIHGGHRYLQGSVHPYMPDTPSSLVTGGQSCGLKPGRALCSRHSWTG